MFVGVGLRALLVFELYCAIEKIRLVKKTLIIPLILVARAPQQRFRDAQDLELKIHRKHLDESF